MSSGFAVFVLFIISLALLAFCGWLLYKQGVFNGFKESGIFTNNGKSQGDRGMCTVPRSGSSRGTYMEYPKAGTARVYATS